MEKLLSDIKKYQDVLKEKGEKTYQFKRNIEVGKDSVLVSLDGSNVSIRNNWTRGQVSVYLSSLNETILHEISCELKKEITLSTTNK
jgi:hypothetical protein